MYKIYGINEDDSLDNDYALERIEYMLDSQMIVTPQISTSNNFDTYIFKYL